MPAPNLAIFIKMSGGTLPPNTRAGDVEIYDNGRMVIFESDADTVERQIDRNQILDILRFAREQGFFQLPNIVHDSDSPTVPDVTINLIDSMGNATVTMTGYQKLRGEMRQGPFDKVYKKVTDLAWQSYTTGQAPVAPQPVHPQQAQVQQPQPTAPMPSAMAQQPPAVQQPPADNFQIAPPPFSMAQEKPVPFELPSLDEILKQSNLDFGDKSAPDQVPGKIPHLPPLKAAQPQPAPEQSMIGDDSLQPISLPPLPNLSFQEPQDKIPHLPPLKSAATVTKQGQQQQPQPAQNQQKQQPAAPKPQQPQQKQQPPQQNQPKQQPQQKPKEDRPQQMQQPAPQQPKRVEQPPKPQQVQAPIEQARPPVVEVQPAPVAEPAAMQVPQATVSAPVQKPEQPRQERMERPERTERPERQDVRPEPPKAPAQPSAPQAPRIESAKPKIEDRRVPKVSVKKPSIAWEVTQELVNRLEESLKGKVLTFYVADDHSITIDDMRFLYSHLRKMGKKKTLYVLPVIQNGDITVMWRMATLLREFCQEMYVIMPDASSVCTSMLSLSADSILMNPFGYLSPIEMKFTHPLIEGYSEDTKIDFPLTEVLAASVAPVKTRSKASENELVNSIDNLHPLVITAAKRQYNLMRLLCANLLKLGSMKEKSQTDVDKIVTQLTETYPSASYPIAYFEAKEIGLQVKETTEEVNDLLWELIRNYMHITKPVIAIHDRYKSVDQQSILIESSGRRTVFYKEHQYDTHNNRMVDEHNRWRDVMMQISVNSSGQESKHLQWKELELLGIADDTDQGNLKEEAK